MPANYVLLERVEVGATAVSSITFNSIPQTGYTDLKVVASVRTTYAGFLEMGLFFNGNASSGYSYRRLVGDGASATSGNATTGGGIITATLGTTATANVFSSHEIYIPNYTSTNSKSVSIDSTTENNATTSYLNLVAGLSTLATAITSVGLGIGAGNFVQYSSFSLYGLAAVGTTPTKAPKASGGSIIQTDGTYWYHAFLASGTFTPAVGLSCDVLVVAGGGGGGGGVGGGGGAGGYRTTTSLSVSTATSITVGGGGAGGTGNYPSTTKGTEGSNSIFSSITSSGGGGGAKAASAAGAGGSGGGAGSESTSTAGAGNAGSYSPVEGYAGGGPGWDAPNYPGSGGGGAGGVGVRAASASSSGGAGGVGSFTAISGGATTGVGVLSGGNYYFAGGGGGGVYVSGSGGAGGLGGGGAAGALGASGTAATPNTGGGGGGCSNNSGQVAGKGGSGIVIIRYAV
jgi:hypothetical protein